MHSGLIAAASLGASRGIVEFELREWPIAAAAAAIGLSLAAQVLAERPGGARHHGSGTRARCDPDRATAAGIAG